MEIKAKSGQVGANTAMPPSDSSYLVNGYTVDHLVGRVLTLIETLGLKDSQEKAVKDLVRQEIWQPFNNDFAQYVSGDFAAVIRDTLYQVKNYYQKNVSETIAVPGATLTYEVIVRD